MERVKDGCDNLMNERAFVCAISLYTSILFVLQECRLLRVIEDMEERHKMPSLLSLAHTNSFSK